MRAVGMLRIPAKELRGRSITVNAAPGPTAAPLLLSGKPQEAIDTLAAMPPLQRSGEPAGIAEPVAALARIAHEAVAPPPSCTGSAPDRGAAGARLPHPYPGAMRHSTGRTR